MRRLAYLALSAAIATAMTVLPGAASAQKKDSLVVGMALEPPGLDPTIAPAAAIGEITHYNIFEGLTKIKENAEVVPLLAANWTASEDLKTWTFKLKAGVKFADGSAFDSADVKDSFTRYGGEKSTNKNKKTFENMAEIATPDAQTVVIRLKNPDPVFLFNLGLNTAVITAPETAATNATNPVGTGPFKVEKWVKGDSVTLVKTPTYRDPGAIKLSRVTFKFISDPAATVAAVLAGDVDAFPIGVALESIDQFRKDARFVVTEGTTEGDTVLAINNKRKPLDDVRVRRAISHAIDRKAIVDGAMSGFGKPIGSHFAPHNPAYVDLTGMYPHDPAKARALLKEAGVGDLELTLKLPPPAYARRGGEIIAAQLAAVGIKARIENVEWAQWLDVVFKNKNYDLSIVSHVEPNDIDVYTKPGYYFQYENAEFNALIDKAGSTLDAKERTRYLQAAQRKLAEDAVNGYLFNLPRVSVFKKGLTGLWVNAPIFANDLTAVSWQ